MDRLFYHGSVLTVAVDYDTPFLRNAMASRDAFKKRKFRVTVADLRPGSYNRENSLHRVYHAVRDGRTQVRKLSMCFLRAVQDSLL